MDGARGGRGAAHRSVEEEASWGSVDAQAMARWRCQHVPRHRDTQCHIVTVHHGPCADVNFAFVCSKFGGLYIKSPLCPMLNCYRRSSRCIHACAWRYQLFYTLNSQYLSKLHQTLTIQSRCPCTALRKHSWNIDFPGETSASSLINEAYPSNHLCTRDFLAQLETISVAANFVQKFHLDRYYPESVTQPASLSAQRHERG